MKLLQKMSSPLTCTFVAIALVTAGTPQGVAAAGGSPTGAISGVVEGPDGAVLPGVTVTVSSPALQGTRTSVTGADGQFIVRGLPPGTYTVKYELSGFTTGTTERVGVHVGQTTSFVGTMGLDTISEEITVSGTYVAIDSKQVDVLPINREAFSTTPEAMTASVQLGPAGGQLRMGGGAPYENLFLLNGVVVNDNLFGNATNLFIEDAIAETTTQTSGVSAEYGRFTGGVVNVITKSGGNEFDGSIHGEFFDTGWGNEPKQFTRPDQSDQIYTGTLGGPIIRDRLWFFGAAGNKRSSFNTTTAIGVPNNRNADDLRYEGKLTATITPRHTLIGNYMGLDGDDKGVPPFSNSLTSTTFLNPSRSSSLATARYTGVITDNFFVEAQYSQRTFAFLDGGGTSRDLIDSPLFSFTGAHLYNPARDGLVDDERDNENLLVKGSYFLSTKGLGSHDLSFGYDSFTTDRSGSPNSSSTGMSIVTDFQQNAAGGFVLDSSGAPNPTFTPGRTIALFNRTFLPSTASSKTDSFFVSDQWRLQRFTLDLGVRAQSSTIDAGGTTLAEDSNVAPRLGFTWDVAGKGRSVIRGGYGIYYDSFNVKLASDGAFEESALAGVFRGLSGSGTTYAPAFNPNSYQLFAINDPSAITTVNPSLASPFTHEYTIGISQRLGSRGIFHGTYVDRTFKDFIDDVVPSGAPTTVSGNGVSSLFDTTFITNPPGASRRYRALEAQVERRFSNNYQFVASYVFSSLIGNYSGLATADTTIVGNYNSLFDLSRHFPDAAALPDEDQRHRARVWATYSLPLGDNSFDIGAIYRYDSGRAFRFSTTLPLTSIQQALANSGGFLNEPTTQTIFFNDGESGHFEASHQFDAAATFNFKPSVKYSVFLKGEAYNLTNAQPLIGFDTSVTAGGPADRLGLPTTYTKAASFGQARSASDFPAPRTYRFSVGLRF